MKSNKISNDLIRLLWKLPDQAMIHAHIELLGIAIDTTKTYKVGEEQVLKDFQRMLN
ncbi:MAG: hypothetical protein AAFQ94_29630 [Bacteroidota bacterium]